VRNAILHNVIIEFDKYALARLPVTWSGKTINLCHSSLRGDQHARAQAAFGDCLADDFFRTAETIDWSDIDDING
jgi:hypothetical protein